MLVPGKNEGRIAKRLNLAFRERGWREGQYDTHVTSILTLGAFKPAGGCPVLAAAITARCFKGQ